MCRADDDDDETLYAVEGQVNGHGRVNVGGGGGKCWQRGGAR